MDDMDDILNNSRAAEDSIPGDDDDEDEEEEGDEEEEEEEDNGDDDDEDTLGSKNDTSETGNQVEDNEEDDDDNEEDDEDAGEMDDNGESDEESDSSEEGNESKNESQSAGNGNSQEQKTVPDSASPKVETQEANGSDTSPQAILNSTDDVTKAVGGTQNSNTAGELDESAERGDKDVEMTDEPEKYGTKDKKIDAESSAASNLDELHNYYTQLLRSAKIADIYNIYPTAAIPIQTDVNAIAMSKGLKFLFLGGSDGFIRKYDFLNTMDGKLALTILQKHSLAESIQNAGILVSYWENEIPQKKSQIKFLKNNREYEPKVSPVHAIEVQSECLFLLSGLHNGGINLQGVRYMEGSVGHYFKGRQGHTNVVNILKLNGQEDRFLSGSWDKRLLEWDLQTGNVINEFDGGTSEYSSLEMRPLYSTVNVNDVAAKLKNAKLDGQDQDGDDDMGSLFGDDEEEDTIMKNDPDNNGRSTAPSSSSYVEEISKHTLNLVYDESIFMTSGLNGSVSVWDRRITEAPVLSLERGAKIPPWCQSACWSMDGDHIFVGRRNALVEEFDLKMPSKPSNTLKLPGISGPVSCVKTMPNNRQILCASRDNIRIYDTKADFSKGSTIPFLIVPGHHGGSISNLYIDPTCRFLISTSGNRGWQGSSTDTTFIYEIDLG